MLSLFASGMRMGIGRVNWCVLAIGYPMVLLLVRPGMVRGTFKNNAKIQPEHNHLL